MDIESAPSLSYRNRAAISADTDCGCYYCIRVFRGDAIREWADVGQDTALCPHCGIDAVLPGVTDAAVLKAAAERWFCSSATEIE